MAQTKEKLALEKKLSDSKANFRKLSAELKRIEAVVTALASSKAYSVEMLGQNKARGGTNEHRKNRYDVLERVRRVGNLTEAQNGQWELFKTRWDALKAEEEGENWGRRFAENMQGVLDRLLNGEETAFSQFVKQETDRVLITTGALVAPGFPILADNGQGLP